MGSDGNGRQLRLGSASPAVPGNTSSATRIIMLVNILFVMFVYPSSHTARCCEIRLGFGLCCRRKPPQPLKSTFAIRLLKRKSNKSTTRGSHSHSTGTKPPTPEPPAQTPHQHFGLPTSQGQFLLDPPALPRSLPPGLECRGRRRVLRRRLGGPCGFRGVKATHDLSGAGVVPPSRS